jgi:hypothetical protein
MWSGATGARPLRPFSGNARALTHDDQVTERGDHGEVPSVPSGWPWSRAGVRREGRCRSAGTATPAAGGTAGGRTGAL